ncbi:MAG TPA: RNA methyltransferase [Propioniciclava sp.]|jgi:tRNA G18 (ribose-2'-O)-methylase SpoU|uniref:TrmH family RNA methyltransferase n=1 Tax=Propioniciclava sp. TaxID=2038686 RepID=UPI002BDCB543|nr:RNA methyltransferase [Propioniciclava sp.]HRL48745.1 RNA methyltransferase [Propioniciclava sp.]HRL78715.1 RNA methyltransferase [Propioniciclava sp.]
MLIPVTDPSDPRLADYVALRDTSLRKAIETERGLFIAEGEKVIRRALEAGYSPRSFLLAERWLPGLSDVLAPHEDVPLYVVSEAMAEAVTGFHVHRGALASLHRRPPTPMSDLLGARRLVVAEDIVDHTNVGALLRNAAGLGWDGVLLAPRAADPLYRRAVKVSMGTVFSLPWARVDDWATALPTLRQAGFTVVALALTTDAIDLDAFVAAGVPDKLAVVVGTEGDGLSAHWIAQADAVVSIPMQHGVDSLNVAAATAVACWALR